MDTTAAAELGMGSAEGLEGVGEWNGEGWQEQEYEFVPPVRSGKSTRATRGGEGNEHGLLAANQGRMGPGQGRPVSSGVEPPQKRMRRLVMQGHAQENGDYDEEEDYGDGGQGLDYNSGQNFESDDWYGAESASGYGHSDGADGVWYPSYAPGVAPQQQMLDPRMMPNFYQGPVNYGPAGPMNFFGMAVPTPSGGAGSGMGRGNTARIFYKTKLCSKFKAGTCTFDAHCNFAHGAAELRKPPPGWDNPPIVPNQNGWGRSQHNSAPNPSDGRGQKGRLDFQRPHKTRPCKNYFIDGVCPYGDNCSFLHEVEGMQPRAIRENSSWVPRRAPGAGRRGGRGGRGSSRSLGWKTQMCRRWETTGECYFGENCRFAHGTGELHKYSGSFTDSLGGSGAYSTSHKDDYGVSGRSTSTNAPYTSSEGPKASVDMKAPIDGAVNMYEEWDDDNEWEGQYPEEIRGQLNQFSKNDCPGDDFYPGEQCGGQSFQQAQQNVPYYYMTNSHNGGAQVNSNQKTGARGTARNMNADRLDDEEEYFELDADHRENYELHV